MKRQSGFNRIVLTFFLLFMMANTAIGKEEMGENCVIQNASIFNLQNPWSEQFFLIWEQSDKHGSDIFYRTIYDSNFSNSSRLTNGKNESFEPIADYCESYGILIAFTQLKLGINNIVIVGKRIDPPAVDKRINIHPVNGGIGYLAPGDVSDLTRGVIVTNGSAEVYTSDVAAGEYGAHVVWVSQTLGDVSSSEIIYRYVGSDMSTDFIQISTTDVYADTEPVVTLNTSSGMVHIFWTSQSPDGDTDIYYSYGTPVSGFSPEMPVAGSNDDENHPETAAGDDGLVYLVYETGDDGNREVEGLYIDAGSLFPITVHSPNSSNDTNPTVTVDASGIPMMAWQNDGDGSICVMAKEFCTPGGVCQVTAPGPYQDIFPSIAASLIDSYPTIAWCRLFDKHETSLFIKGPQFPAGVEIE